MIFEQLAGTAALFLEFHTGNGKSLLDFCRPLLEQPIKFVLTLFYIGVGVGGIRPLKELSFITW